MGPPTHNDALLVVNLDKGLDRTFKPVEYPTTVNSLLVSQMASI